MENKSEPDYTLGFTVSRDIKFTEHGNTIVPAHVKPLVFRDQEHGAATPTGSRHEQRTKKVGRRERSNQHPALAELQSCSHQTRRPDRAMKMEGRQPPAMTWTLKITPRAL
jgi:hypothetical protein